MELGISTACFFGRLLTEDAVVKIGEMGINSAEVFLCCASEYNAPYVRELKKRLMAYNITVSSVHALAIQFESQLFTSHQRAREDAYAVFTQVLEAASILNAQNYTFHGATNVKRTKKPLASFEKVAEYASTAAEKAKEYGIRLAWENVHWCLFSDTYFLKNLLAAGVSDNLYFTLDIKQAAQAGVLPEDFVACMGRRLANVHVCDYTEDAERGILTRLPFEGSTDFTRLKNALRDIGYTGPLTYEVYESDYTSEQKLKENFDKTRRFFMD